MSETQDRITLSNERNNFHPPVGFPLRLTPTRVPTAITYYLLPITRLLQEVYSHV